VIQITKVKFLVRRGEHSQHWFVAYRGPFGGDPLFFTFPESHAAFAFVRDVLKELSEEQIEDAGNNKIPN
jgi:hypothetical protein